MKTGVNKTHLIKTRVGGLNGTNSCFASYLRRDLCKNWGSSCSYVSRVLNKSRMPGENARYKRPNSRLIPIINEMVHTLCVDYNYIATVILEA